MEHLITSVISYTAPRLALRRFASTHVQDIQMWQASLEPETTDSDSSFQITTLPDGQCRVYHPTFNDVAETIAQKLQVRHPAAAGARDVVEQFASLHDSIALV